MIDIDIDTLNTELESYIADAKVITNKIQQLANNKNIPVENGVDTPADVLDNVNSGTIATPTGSLTLSTLSSYNVTNYASAQVDSTGITSGNIRSGTTILGVQGSLTPGITPSGTLPISQDGIYDVTYYANVEVTSSGGSDNRLPDLFNDTLSVANQAYFDGCSAIPEYAFSKRLSLISVTIPDTVTNIGNSAFDHCTNLEDVDIDGSMYTNFGSNVFAGCSKLVNVSITNITNIGNSMFANCALLRTLYLPETITSIGNAAFSNTKIEELTIPESVANIGNRICANDNSLTDIYVNTMASSTKITSYSNSWVYGCSANVTIHLRSEIEDAATAYTIFGSYFDNISNNTKCTLSFDL